MLIKKKLHALILITGEDIIHAQFWKIIKNLDKMSTSQLAKALGRTVSILIEHKVNVLKIPSSNHSWTEAELQFVKRNSKVMTAAQIGIQLKRSGAAVSCAKRKLGLTKQSYTKWTKEEKEYIVNNYRLIKSEKLAKKIGKSEEAVRAIGNKLLSAEERKSRPWHAEDELKWTDLQNELLRENYPNKEIAVADIASALGKNGASIRAHAIKLKLKRNKPEDWSKKEISLLKKYYPRMGAKYVSEKIKRSMLSVITKAGRLKIKREIKWPAWQELYLRRNYLQKSTSAIARTVGHTPGAVRTRGYNMGFIKGAPDWMKKNIEILKDLYPKGVSVEEISALTGHNIMSIYNKTNELGIRRIPVLTAEEEQFIRSNCNKMTYQEIGKALNIDRQIIGRRVRSFGLGKNKLNSFHGTIEQ